MDCKTNDISIIMKKYLLILALLAGGSIAVSAPMTAPESTYRSNDRQLPEDARELTVYSLVHISGTAWSSSPKSAYFSRSTNCIYVTENNIKNIPYDVHENRAYGQDNDGRAAYRYVAGGYYFNL